MPFTLKVSSGGDSEEFNFEGGEVRLGRTADNDIVIKDPSSSRSHARVYEDAGRFFVEDMKSANGTRLNQRALKAPAELKRGDRITIGDVELLFTMPDVGNDTVLGVGSSTVDESVEEGDPNQTILKPLAPRVAAIVRKPPARPPPSPSATADEEADAPVDDEPDDEVVSEPDNSTMNFEVPPPRALQRKSASVAVARAANRAAPEELVTLSAADRARERRELKRSSSGRVVLLWNDLAKPVKWVVGILGVMSTLALLVGIAWAVIPRKRVVKVEPTSLVANADPIRESFGEGDDVDFEKRDMKAFTFNYASPTAIVGVLHYQASDCNKDEVSIELNGNSLGNVPADTIEAATRQLEVVLPSAQLKVGDENELVFDNTANPPGRETWKIWNIWVEIIPIPQMTPEEASGRAKEEIKRAESLYEMRAVGAMNLFRAWKEYRVAWLLLEATPNRPPELVQLARTRMQEIRPELDRKCSAMLVDYQKQMNQRYANIEGARQVLQNIPSHFEKEHPCFGMSRGLLRQLDDFGDNAATE